MIKTLLILLIPRQWKPRAFNRAESDIEAISLHSGNYLPREIRILYRIKPSVIYLSDDALTRYFVSKLKDTIEVYSICLAVEGGSEWEKGGEGGKGEAIHGHESYLENIATVFSDSLLVRRTPHGNVDDRAHFFDPAGFKIYESFFLAVRRLVERVHTRKQNQQRHREADDEQKASHAALIPLTRYVDACINQLTPERPSVTLLRLPRFPPSHFQQPTTLPIPQRHDVHIPLHTSAAAYILTRPTASRSQIKGTWFGCYFKLRNSNDKIRKSNNRVYSFHSFFPVLTAKFAIRCFRLASEIFYSIFDISLLDIFEYEKYVIM